MTSKQELTIANIADVFKSCSDQDKIFDLLTWEKITVDLLSNFYTLDNNLKFIPFDETIQYIGGFVKIDKNSINVWHEDVTKITFNAAFPSIIVNHIENGSMHFNITDFGKLYCFIFKNRNFLKKYNSEIYPTIKQYINFTFGILGISKNMIKTNIGPYSISSELHSLMENIYTNFLDNIISIDTDTIYFHNYENIKDDIELFIKENTYLEYDLEYGYCGTFMAVKRRITIKNGIIYHKGLKKFKRD